MKTLYTIILMSQLFVGCGENTNCKVGYKCDGVSQEIQSGEIQNDICGDNSCLWTYVWYKNDIVWSSYLRVSTDSTTIKHHLDSAEAIFKNLKSIK